MAAPRPPEEDLDRALRPSRLDDFIGQQKIKDNLRVFVTAALQRGEALDHVLLSGPPGLGKTTLAHIIAEEMGAQVKTTCGPVLDKPATSPACSRTSTRATCSSSTRSTGCPPWSRSTSTRRWRTTASTS